MFETTKTFKKVGEVTEGHFTTHIFETLHMGQQTVTWPTHRRARVVQCQQCGELMAVAPDDRTAYNDHLEVEHDR